MTGTATALARSESDVAEGEVGDGLDQAAVVAAASRKGLETSGSGGQGTTSEVRVGPSSA